MGQSRCISIHAIHNVSKHISRHERSQDTVYHICFTMTLQEMITDMRVSASSDTKVALTLFNKKRKRNRKRRKIG